MFDLTRAGIGRRKMKKSVTMYRALSTIMRVKWRQLPLTSGFPSASIGMYWMKMLIKTQILQTVTTPSSM